MNRYNKILLVAVITAIAGFYLLTIREGQLWGDFSHYIQHAKNIAENKSYGNTGYIFNPSFPWASKSYPPVLPLLLAPVYKLFGLNLTIMKIEILIFFIGALVVIYFLFKQNIIFPYLLSIIALIGFNPYFWDFKENIVSDIPFLFFSCLCLYVLNRVYTSENFSSLNIFISAFLLCLAVGTRTIGITLIIALIIYDILKIKRPSPFLLKVVILCVVFIGLQQIIIRTSPTYSEEFYFSVRTLFRSLISHSRFLSLFWHNGYFVLPTIILSSCLLALAALGFIRRVKERFTIFECYLPIYVLFIVIWPTSGEGRYLIPIIPFYLFYIFTALGRVNPAPTIRKPLFYILIAGAGISYIGRYTTMNYGPINGVTNKECTELFNYIKEETDSTDVIIFARPRVLALYTERKSAVFPFPWDDERIWNYFKKINVTYIVVGAEYFTIGKAKAFGIDQKYIIPFIKRYIDKFHLKCKNKGFEVYKITGE